MVDGYFLPSVFKLKLRFQANVLNKQMPLELNVLFGTNKNTKFEAERCPRARTIKES